MIKALTTPVSKRALSSDTADDYFSSVSVWHDGSTGRITSTSRLTQFNVLDTGAVAAERGSVTLSVAVSTDGASALTFNGSGSVTTTQGQYSISSGQYSLPAQVPLDATLFQYQVPASLASSVRIFVGTIQGTPNVMRVCWNFDLPGPILRVVCSRNDMTTGNPIGVDAGNDLAGRILTHQSLDTGTIRWQVNKCYRRYRQMSEFGEGWVFMKSFFDTSKPYGGVVTLPWPYGEVTVTPYNATGFMRVAFGTPNGSRWYDIQEGDGVLASNSYGASGTVQIEDSCTRLTD